MFLSALLLLLVLLLLPLLLLLWLALRPSSSSSFWRKRGIPGPEPASLLKGNIDSIFGEIPAVLQLQQWTKQFGPVYGIQEGWYQQLVISDPAMVRELLVDKFEYFHGRMITPLVGDVDKTKLVHLFAAKGKRWKRLRTIATPAFSVTNLKRVMPTIDHSIRVTMALLDEACAQGGPVNLHTFFTEMTIDVIARVSMGQRESMQFRSPYLKLAREVFSQFGNSWWDYTAMLFPWLGRNLLRPILLCAGFLLNDPLIILLDVLFQAVRERKQEREQGKKEGKGRDVDFIDLFLEAESSVQLTDEDRAYNKADKFERKNCIEEIAMNCLLFLLAGFDTTANSLSVICHNLAIHPEVQERLWEEIDSICADDGEEEGEGPSYEQLAQLKYTDAVIKESLRLCPIASSVITRIASESTSLGHVPIEKGTVVKVDVFSLHGDRAIWGEDVEQFRPERWLEPGFSQPSAFYPFGGGPRICIGMRLAMLEERMALARLVRRFRLKKCPATETELKFTGQVVMNPNAVTVELERRMRG